MGSSFVSQRIAQNEYDVESIRGAGRYTKSGPINTSVIESIIAIKIITSCLSNFGCIFLTAISHVSKLSVGEFIVIKHVKH
jgi:hypothetical protein